MANQLKEKQKKLKKLRIRNIILNLVCICLAGSGLWWTATYFWRYVNYEVTNDAFVDQYVAPLNVRASGYIKEVCFKEHQYVRQGDTLLPDKRGFFDELGTVQQNIQNDICVNQ